MYRNWPDILRTLVLGEILVIFFYWFIILFAYAKHKDKKILCTCGNPWFVTSYLLLVFYTLDVTLKSLGDNFKLRVLTAIISLTIGLIVLRKGMESQNY